MATTISLVSNTGTGGSGGYSIWRAPCASLLSRIVLSGEVFVGTWLKEARRGTFGHLL